MDPLHITAGLIRHPEATAFSALPDAPVVPPPDSVGTGAAARARLAAALHRLADAVAPSGAAPRGAYAGGR